MKLVIFDLMWTLYDPEKGMLTDGALEVLEKLHGKARLAIVTRGDDKRMNILRETGIEEYFSDIVIRAEKKAEDYRGLIEKYCSRPDDAFIVGDVVEKEIRLGNALGAVTVWLKSGKYASVVPKDEASEPDYVISNLTDVLKIVG